jgi:hypothetical protein
MTISLMSSDALATKLCVALCMRMMAIFSAREA